MTFSPRRLLITGGAGFIGSHLAEHVLGQATADLERVVILDALTYAGHRVNLRAVENDARFVFVHADICDATAVHRAFTEHDIDAVMHLAAESHVDRSIESGDVFLRTNVQGTFVLLDAALRAWQDKLDRTRFLHVSTDEVYGALGTEGVFTEDSPYAPNSPYAASKAASDLFARSFAKTHGLGVIITHCCNNYGPRQLPEKLVPLMIANAAAGLSLPVYGEGKQVREWLHARDHAEGLWLALIRGRPFETYNFGGSEERTNLALVEQLAALVDARLGRDPSVGRSLISFVPDRKGHDFRYAIDSSKAQRELAWTEKYRLETELESTVRWYLENAAWRDTVRSAEHERFQAAYYAGAKGERK